MTKKSFILYHDTYDSIKDLSFEDKGKLFDAIFNYSLENEVNVDGEAGMAFKFIKSQLDRDSNKYDKYIEKQRANGKKGGKAKQAKPTQAPPSQTKQADTVNDTVTVNDNDIKETPLSPPKGKRVKGKRLDELENVSIDEMPDEWEEVADKIKNDKNWKWERWDDFYRYFTGVDAKQPVKKDWKAAWRTWLRREQGI